jgi:chromate reductase, NAD(P)H dehydrogenase (quinone)
VSARQLVAKCDGVVIVTPEFNHGIPGVLKNTLDWLSRPAFTGCFVTKPAFFCTISPGALGGVRAQSQLRETLSSMLCELFPMPEIVIPHVGQKFQDGEFIDRNTIDFISSSVDRFIRGIEARNATQSALSAVEA